MSQNQLHTIPYKVGTFVMGQQFQGGKYFECSLKDLPRYVQRPDHVAHVTEFELKLTSTIATLTSDPAIKSYVEHMLLDWELVGPTGEKMSIRKGWHDPIRSALRTGRIKGLVGRDIAATGGGGAGSFARTFTKHMGFEEPHMSGLSRLARMMPAIAFAKTNSRLRWLAWNTVQALVGGSSPSLSALTIDVYAHLIDLPADKCIVPVFIEEGSADGKVEVNPSPGNGSYLRVALANSPFFATKADDLSDYTTIDSFGTPGNYARYGQDVDQIMREFVAELVDPAEAHRITDAVATGQKEEFRFLDPNENNSGRLHAIPLVYPRPGQDISQMRGWFGNEPTLKANNNSRANLPASVDFLFDRIRAREAPMVTAILNALGPRAVATFTQKGGIRAHVPRDYAGHGKIDASRVPLIVDGSEG